MKTPRGYALWMIGLAALATSAYFGYQGRQSILAPATTLSQATVVEEPASAPPKESNYVQVIVPERPVAAAEPRTQPPPEESGPLPQPAPNEGEVLVSRVVDGDTLELANGEKVRLIGVDTPETVHPDKAVQCFGAQAREFTTNLLEGQWVRLETDVGERDRYGRTLAYVWRGELFVNDTLVGEGFARAATFPPNVKYADQFRASEARARREQKGLWQECE